MKNIKYHISTIMLVTLLSVLTGQAQDDWTWEEAAPMEVSRMGHSAVAYDNKIYVFGGMTFHRQNVLISSVEIYDPETDEWTAGENLPSALYQASAVVSGRLIYIIGGTTLGGEPNVEITVFDPRDDHHPYSRVGRLPTPRWAVGTVAVGRRILVLGGISGRQEYLRDGYWWNPADSSGHWVQAPQLNQPSAGFGLVSNGTLWAVGGISFGPLNRVEVLRNNAWVQLPRQSNLPEPRGELGLTFLGDTMMIAAGGFGRAGAESDVFALATDSLRWRRFPSLREARAEFSLVTVGEEVYAIGGGTSTPNHVGFILATVEVLRKSNDVDDDPDPIVPSQFETAIWPNPVNGIVSISLPDVASRLQIIDLNGRIINNSSISDDNRVWREDVSSYPAGNYQVIYFDAGGIARPAGGLTVLK